jgi:hypothetical protein
MAAPTFLQVLAAEVARMQTLHPERTGELARAHALIRMGAVCPTADDPETATVISSDGTTTYRVNGTCNCQAGQHGKPCKHLASWKLFQYIDRKLAAQAVLEPAPMRVDTTNSPAPLPEAAASLNLRVLISGHEVQMTLRGDTEAALLDRLHTLLKRQDIRPVPKPAPRSGQWRKRP